MILNLFVAVDLILALFALIVGSYTAFKAYKIEDAIKTASNDQRYELEKDFSLVSTVGWMTMGARILAIPLFFATVISLIPAVPGAMCEFGVFQAGAPFSWANLGLKLFTMFAFGGWLFFDFINRKLRSSPYIGSLSRFFVLLVPLLFIDVALDLVFFGSLEPLVVPCCMVIYSYGGGGLFNIGCPFCFITYSYPLLWIVIPAYAVSVALMVWSYLFTRLSKEQGHDQEVSPYIKKVMKASIILAVIGTLFLIIQVALGKF